MFNFAKNIRSYQLSFIISLVTAFLARKIWSPTSVLVTHKGKTGPSNLLEVSKQIFEEGKSYTFGNGVEAKSLSAGEIFAKAEMADAKMAGKKLPVLLEGKHRAYVVWFMATFFGINIEPEVVEVGDDVAMRIQLESNLTNEMVARMLNTEKLAGVVDAINKGVYTKQTDIPVKRGQQQTLWHRAQAVIVQKITPENACKLSYKEAEAVTKGALTVEAAVAARAGNEKKVLPGEKIRGLRTMALNYDKGSDTQLSKLLTAICDNAETAAQVAIKDFFESRK